MIRFEDVYVKYDSKLVLKNISFSVGKGQRMLITGKSGTGKSTVLKAMLGFADFEGKIQVNNLAVRIENISKIRKQIAYMPQEINTPLTSIKEFFNYPFSWKSINKGQKSLAGELLKKFNIEPSLLEKSSNEISGGQKQRILLASCISQCKPIYFLDEPDSSIDIENKEIIRKYLSELKEVTMIIVSHDLGWKNYVDKTLNIDSNG